MPTLEERLTALEQSQLQSGDGINDLNHYVTMLVGIVQKQEWEIREIKSLLRTLATDVQVLGQSGQLIAQSTQSLRQEVQSLRQEGQATRQEVQSLRQEGQSLRQEVQSLRQEVWSLKEEQDKKFDQILLLLNTLTGKSN